MTKSGTPQRAFIAPRDTNHNALNTLVERKVSEIALVIYSTGDVNSYYSGDIKGPAATKVYGSSFWWRGYAEIYTPDHD